MPRPRTIPDETVLTTLRRMLVAGGDKAVSFSTVGRATGLAASTLAQRYGSCEGMLQAALADGWVQLAAATEAAGGVEGVAPFLKAVARDREAEIALLAARQGTESLREAAASWRAGAEAAIALRLGGGAKAREAAAMIFAAWQGRILWGGPEEAGFKMKDAVKRLS